MKISILILSFVITINTFGSINDTVTLNSKITDVTLFFHGAQITRKAKINLPKGKHLLVLDKLPYGINPQSIQVDNNGKGEILSVNYETATPDNKSKLVSGFEDKIQRKKTLLKELQNKTDICDIEEKILLDNSILNNKEGGTTIEEIKKASEFYRTKLNEIRHDKLNLIIRQDSIKKEIFQLYKELNKKLAKEQETSGKISFVIECKTPVNSYFHISYFVPSAGWNPLYDFRVNNINEPLTIVYNANIHQSTGEDWNNVNLTLSTNRPSVSNTKPELKPWYIDRIHIEKKSISNSPAVLKGKVMDGKTGEPIPFANITVYQNGKLIKGTVSDFDGHYNLRELLPGLYDIKVSFVGYENKEIKSVFIENNRITFQDFRLKPSSEFLEEIEVIDYKIPAKRKENKYLQPINKEDATTVMPGRSENPVYASNVRGIGSPQNKTEIYITKGYQPKQNVVNLEYEIDVPYSVPSDGNDYKVKIKEVKRTVQFVYYAVPKLDKDVFLTAKITNWSQADLLSGKASIYYKGIYTGQTEINANGIKDTLDISLGRDNDVVVERKLLKEKKESYFTGKNVKETVNRSISVKNNKNEKIRIIIEDQFPLSENTSIEIEKIDYSNGKYDKETGIIRWEFEMNPGEKKELTIKYSVKYPGYMHIPVE